jgi:pilus assembly protein HofN
MNTEINFLEKQPNKYLIPLLLLLLFMILLAAVAILIYFQQSKYEQAIKIEEEKISQIETLLQKHNQESASVQQLAELKQEVDLIEDGITPNVALYRTVLGLLDSPDQFISFDYSDSNQFVLNASFENLDSVAQYLSTVLKWNYILDADLSSINRQEDVYLATLTFQIEPDTIREELNHE